MQIYFDHVLHVQFFIVTTVVSVADGFPVSVTGVDLADSAGHLVLRHRSLTNILHRWLYDIFDILWRNENSNR